MRFSSATLLSLAFLILQPNPIRLLARISAASLLLVTAATLSVLLQPQDALPIVCLLGVGTLYSRWAAYALIDMRDRREQGVARLAANISEREIFYNVFAPPAYQGSVTSGIGTGVTDVTDVL